MKKIAFVLVPLLLFCNPNCDVYSAEKEAQQADEKSEEISKFEDAVKAALKNSAGYAMEKLERAISGHQLKNAQFSFLPNIELTAASSHSGDRRKSYNAADFTNENQSMFQVVGELKQNIFNGFSSINNMKSMDELNESAKYKLEAAKQELIQKALEAMINLWYSHQDLTFAEMKMQNLLIELNAQKNSFQVGSATSYHVAEAEANYAQAVYDRDLANSRVLSCEAEFTKVTGAIAAAKIEMPDFLCDLPKTLKLLEDAALKKNYGIISAKHSEKAAAYEVSKIRGKLSPKLDMIARVQKSLEGVHDHRTEHNIKSVSLQLTIPVFNNSENDGNTYSAIAIANEKAKKASFQMRDIVTSVMKECSMSFNEYQSAQSMIRAAETAVKSAQVGADGYRQESALGLKSNTEALVRENQLYDSRKSLAQSKARMILAKGKMLQLMGELTLENILRCKKPLK